MLSLQKTGHKHNNDSFLLITLISQNLIIGIRPNLKVPLSFFCDRAPCCSAVTTLSLVLFRSTWSRNSKMQLYAETLRTLACKRLQMLHPINTQRGKAHALSLFILFLCFSFTQEPRLISLRAIVYQSGDEHGCACLEIQRNNLSTCVCAGACLFF